MPNFENGEEYFHKLYIRFNGSIAVTLLPMGWLLLQLQAGRLLPISDNLTISWLLTGLILSVSVYIFFFAKKSFEDSCQAIAANESLRTKLNLYFSTSNRKFLIFLFAKLLTAIGFFLTASKLFIVGYIIGLILLSLKRPSLSSFLEDLKLSEDEKNILLEKKPIQ